MRSHLAVPGPDALELASTAGADVVVVDAGLLDALDDPRFDGCRVFVRTELRDVRRVVTAAGAALAGLVIPRVESAETLRLAELLSQRSVPLMASIETARGLLDVERILSAAAEGSRLEAVVFGVPDLGALSDDYAVLTHAGASGGRRRHRGDRWHYAMASIAVACRAAGLRAIDGRPGDAGGDDAYLAAARRALALGFHGKRASHARQVALANAVFGRRQLWHRS